MPLLGALALWIQPCHLVHLSYMCRCTGVRGFGGEEVDRWGGERGECQPPRTPSHLHTKMTAVQHEESGIQLFLRIRRALQPEERKEISGMRVRINGINGLRGNP